MIGDVLTSSVLFEALRYKYPKAQLHYLINRHTYPVVENNPFIDHFVLFNHKEKNKTLFSIAKMVRNSQYDVVIDVYCKMSSLLIMLISSAKIKITYSKWYTNLLPIQTFKKLQTPENNSSLALENRIRLLKPLGINFKNAEPKIYLSESEINWANTFLKNNGVDIMKPLVMISVLGSSEAKTYPNKYMAQILNAIREHSEDIQILFNYIPKQKDAAKDVYQYCHEKTQQAIFINVFGNGLREFLAILHFCEALIGNEGDAVNMAKALNKPTFIIFSPYLNKHNWFGSKEEKKHMAVHLADYIPYDSMDFENAKKNPKKFYLKFKPSFILPKLNIFLNNHLN